MSSLSLEEFIYQVKRELLEAQQKHEGEPVYLELQKVELEVSVTVTKTARGKVNIYVADLGSDVAKDHAQRVKLEFEVVPFDILPEASGGGGTRRGGKNFYPKKAVRKGGVGYKPSR
jgi:NTP-dependent ternary system trypsin peptidase co-occuring protein